MLVAQPLLLLPVLVTVTLRGAITVVVAAVVATDGIIVNDANDAAMLADGFFPSPLADVVGVSLDVDDDDEAL